MNDLQFSENVCLTCPTADCMMKCQYIRFGSIKEAHGEMMKVVRGEDSRILSECVTCYACEEYCRRGNHPYLLIGERREEKGLLSAPRPIAKQWINLTRMQGKQFICQVNDTALSCCLLPELMVLATGEIFNGVSQAVVFGAEFMCPAVHSHFSKMSVIRERLPLVIENFRKLGVKEVIFMHDECYGTFTSIAPAYGYELPFRPIYYMDFLLERLTQLKDRIKPLNIRAAYQRPCSNRLIPDKLPLVKQILDLIGVELPERTYQGENALCCGEVFKATSGYQLVADVQGRNISDMLASGADYCVFNCPACQVSLSEKVKKEGLKPVHLVDLCKIAIGEKRREEFL
ncbi:MAG: heterodisulfide reductase-related iron-sulfur binding cluster [Syntrophales bacterium]